MCNIPVYFPAGKGLDTQVESYRRLWTGSVAQMRR